MDFGLPIDADLLAYWGLDEANDNDVGIDDSSFGSHLTFNLASVPVPGKVGNARSFDGLTIYATAANSSFMRQASDLTLMVWGNLTSVKSTGSLQRTMVACDGPSGATARDNTVFALSVDQSGAIVFRHDRNIGEPVIWKSAPGIYRVNRFNFVAVERTIENDTALVRMWLNGRLLELASVSINGVDGGDPNAVVAGASLMGGEDATVKVGISDKANDSHWHGLLDEISVHNLVRGLTYTTGAYFRSTIFGVFTRLTDATTVRTLGTVDLRDGARWWCYERDQSVYVIRENSLGAFGDEVLLTTGGLAANGAPQPGGASQPRLAYDVDNDTLVVAFLAAGRIYRVTAASIDDPATQNMPFTADTTGIIKTRDATDSLRLAAGQPMTTSGLKTMGVGEVEDANVPGVEIVETPSFGVAITGLNPYGYAVYRVNAGHEVLLGTTSLDAPLTGRPTYPNAHHFFAISERLAGYAYVARPLDINGRPQLTYATSGVDYLGEVRPVEGVEDDDSTVNSAGDLKNDVFDLGAGAAFDRSHEAEQQTFTPIKQTVDDGTTSLAAGQSSGMETEFPYTVFTPIKFPVLDSFSSATGSGTMLRITRGSTEVNQ